MGRHLCAHPVQLSGARYPPLALRSKFQVPPSAFPVGSIVATHAHSWWHSAAEPNQFRSLHAQCRSARDSLHRQAGVTAGSALNCVSRRQQLGLLPRILRAEAACGGINLSDVYAAIERGHPDLVADEVDLRRARFAGRTSFSGSRDPRRSRGDSSTQGPEPRVHLPDPVSLAEQLHAALREAQAIKRLLRAGGRGGYARKPHLYTSQGERNGRGARTGTVVVGRA